MSTQYVCEIGMMGAELTRDGCEDEPRQGCKRCGSILPDRLNECVMLLTQLQA